MNNAFQDAQGAAGLAATGSIRRARERAAAGDRRDSFGTFVRNAAQDAQQQSQQQQQQRTPPRNVQREANPGSARRGIAGQVVVGLPATPRAMISRPQGTAGPAGMPISKPTPAQQWPLAGPIAPSSDAEPYRPPPGRSEPPQRPPRPSNVPSILDSSKIQDQMPTVFAYNAIDQAGGEPSNEQLLPPPGILNGSRVSDLSLAQQSSASSTSRASTISSVGSIPDFPVPISAPVAIPVPPPVAAVPPPRRSVNLGPPPSARRGASSFYSNASFVSPIPEESPRTRSYTSYASSTAIPDTWGSGSSPAMSPSYPDGATFYEDIPEEGRESYTSRYDEEGRLSGAGSPQEDETSLVRSASIGKRGRAAVVTNYPFGDGNGYVDAPSPSSGLNVPSNRPRAGSSLTADNILNAYEVATAADPINTARRSSVSPRPPLANNDDSDGSSRQYSRLSAIRRPPRLDIDAVRQAEARGSLTSLSDLILRATRLAASLDRGKRPASRGDDLSMSPSMYARDLGMNPEGNTEKYQSGLSDMLAAFPPPGHRPNDRGGRRGFREQIGSWPVPYHRNSRAGGQANQEEGGQGGLADPNNPRQRRRCCGLPVWGFVLTVIVVLIIVAAAIVIALEFFVIRKQNTSGSTMAQCQSQLTCANGGTNVISAQGVCSCICTNDFTGTNCTVAGDQGCTTTSVGPTLSNVTLGTAIPRLLLQAQANYSIALSATDILGAFNNGDLSCASENALVTFDGESVRLSSSGSTEVNAFKEANEGGDVDFVVSGADVMTVTMTVEASATAAARLRRDVPYSETTETLDIQITPSVILPSSTTTVTTTITPGATATSSSADGSRTGAAATGTLSSAEPAATFRVTENILDFARVAVLFILQQESLASAEGAQSALQRFFSNATTAAQNKESVADLARNITLPNGNSINLVSLQVSAGTTLAGAGIS